MSSKSQIDFPAVIKKYPWLLQKDLNCILSPDSDGLLCGLLMSHYLNWKIRGFYDTKNIVLEKGFKTADCVFLDMEIFRPNIRSIGQHMVMYDKAKLPPNWKNFDNCVAATNLRNFDFKNDFKVKYPFGTIHLLLALLGHSRNIPILKTAVSLLLYTDGTFKNQFNYPENCLSWLDFLDANKATSPLQKVFMDKQYSTYELMVELKDLFSKFNVIGGGKRGGDKIKLSDGKGNAVNIDPRTGMLTAVARNQAEKFLEMLADKTGWVFNRTNWSWGPYQIMKFQKGSVKPGKANYNNVLAQDPISFAITGRSGLEYTLDENGLL